MTMAFAFAASLALADERLEHQPPLRPAETGQPKFEAPLQGGLNLMTITEDWPKKAYPAPLRKSHHHPYGPEPYYDPRVPDDALVGRYARPEPLPEPRFEPGPGYAAPKDVSGDYADDPRSIRAPGYPERADDASLPPGAPDPELPLAPDFELNRYRGFGRLFPVLGPAYPGGRGLPAQPSSLGALRALGEAMREPGDPEDLAGAGNMPAGYTFLGQLVDHDISLDLSTNLGNGIRGDEVENTRTPDLDLDNVYGKGPGAAPYLYKLPYLRTGRLLDGDGAYLRNDLLRAEPSQLSGPHGGAATALIGDPRDDENLIVAQLHAAVVSFHNRTVDVLVGRRFGRHRYHYCGSNVCSIYRLADALPEPVKKELFETARDHVLHYYHRVIAEDLLPWLIGYQRTADLFTRGRDFYFPHGFQGKDGRLRDPYIPVEFTVAAFRYGHSQVASYYQLREDYRVSLFRGRGRGREDGIRAFEPLTPRHLIDWRYFFEIDEAPPPGFNWARRIDPLVTPALYALSSANVVGPAEVADLPVRNLQRGRVFYLPSGQAVAEQILPVLASRGALPGGYGGGDGQGRYAGGWQNFLLPPDERTRYFLQGEETPLWYYVLQEAGLFGMSRNLAYTPAYGAPYRGRPPLEPVAYEPGPRRGYGGDGGNSLGPVGGTIVGEVLVGLLEHFREKTGKGLAYEPEVRGSTSRNAGPGSYGGKARKATLSDAELPPGCRGHRTLLISDGGRPRGGGLPSNLIDKRWLATARRPPALSSHAGSGSAPADLPSFLPRQYAC